MTEAPVQNRFKMGLIALGLWLIGLFMIAHGLDVIDASWFRPNPKTPHWVFSMIGLILVLSGLLASAQAMQIPKWLFNGAGWSVIALAMVMAHWLVFYAEGARCFAGDGVIFLRISGALCYGVAGLMLSVFDLIFVLIIGGYVRRNLR